MAFAHHTSVVSVRSLDAIGLVIADVDGTLVNSDKQLTDETIEASRKLRAAGIQLMLTSGRPPRGMKMLIEPLALTTPIAAFNGGMLVSPDLSVLKRYMLPDHSVALLHDMLAEHGLAVWAYNETDWFVTDPSGPHVARETWTVQFPPTVVSSMEGITHVVKLVGVHDDEALVEDATANVRRAFGGMVSAARSQPYYLGVTHPRANKGAVVDYAVAVLGVPNSAIAVLGDMPNDLLMFARGGLSIAMGNAGSEVKAGADAVTASNDHEGFAMAIDRFVLPDQLLEDPMSSIPKRGTKP